MIAGIMAATQDEEEHQRSLDIILSISITVISRLVPGWQAPTLEHPCAQRYANPLMMLDDIVAGDQIMVMSQSGCWHHGIYVGKQLFDGKQMDAVVDFWGANKETCKISMRQYSKFASDAAGWAKAAYPIGAALEPSVSAQLAIAFAEHVKEHPITYHLVLRNCEVFATVCRCIRWASCCHIALCNGLAVAPTPLMAPFRRTFK